MINKAHHTFEAPEQLHAWWVNHASESKLWVRTSKRPPASPPSPGTICVVAAFAWGWIDGLRNALDDTSFLQRQTPRPARSN